MSMQTGVVLNMVDRLSLKQYPAASQVDAYWESLRDGAATPLRSAIDPRGIEDALNYAFILESIGAGHARVRIAGMHLNEVMGMEVRGMPISAFITPASREAFTRVILAALKAPAKMQLGLQAEGPFAGEKTSARMLLLPLRDEAGNINRLLGSFETTGRLGPAPLRFALKEVKKTLLNENTPTIPEDAPAAEPCATKGFAEPDTPYEGLQKRPAYLKLIKNGE